MTDAPKYVLRDLPGASDFADLWDKIEAHPNPNWAPEYDLLDPMEARLTQEWFGMSFADVYGRGLTNAQEEAFQAQCRALDEKSSAERLAVMAGLGWDVSDGNGELHPAFWFTHQPLILAAMGLAGRLPDTPISDEEAKARANDWGSSLEAAAANFHSKSRKGRDR
jgi:hypothetical protein